MGLLEFECRLIKEEKTMKEVLSMEMDTHSQQGETTSCNVLPFARR